MNRDLRAFLYYVDDRWKFRKVDFGVYSLGVEIQGQRDKIDVARSRTLFSISGSTRYTNDLYLSPFPCPLR